MFGTMPWSFRSSPDENARPEPVSTTTQVSFSSASAVERVVQLRHQLDRHGVEPVGPVHPHHRDVRAGVLHEHERRLVGHGPGP